MVGWHHRLNGHECEQTMRHSEGQGSLACCHPQDRKGLDTTEQLNSNNKHDMKVLHRPLSNSWGGGKGSEAGHTVDTEGARPGIKELPLVVRNLEATVLWFFNPHPAILSKFRHSPRSLPPFSFSSSIWLREHFMRSSCSGANGFLWGTFISNKVSDAL